MHETVIANQLIEEARRHGDVKAVTIEVGMVAHLTAEELERTMAALVDWELHITDVPARVSCVCGFTGEPQILGRGHDMCLYVCPKCSGAPDIISGGDIKIVSVDV
ncbi:MAG: hydrogenase maturation nickel metallochaperone HypA [Nanoarchaeota archaeon]|nr:hydrogenase maturation nickel metallochaperone HypA [Nanoarchaeota archaeon]